MIDLHTKIYKPAYNERRRSLTINFSAANDRILVILGLLESSHQGESEYKKIFRHFFIGWRFIGWLEIGLKLNQAGLCGALVVGNPIFSLVLGLARLFLVGEVLERYFVNFRYPDKYLTRITSRESASMAA